MGDCLATGLAVWAAALGSLSNPHLGPFPPWLNHATAIAVALTLLARRRAPEVVLAVCLTAYTMHISVFTTFFALYAEGAFRGPRRRSVVAVTALVSLATVSASSTSFWSEPRALLSQQGFAVLLTVLTPLLLGMYMGERRVALLAWVDRAERAEREQTLIADAAVAEERRRIAGEMHDVVSHRVSLMVVHANALQYVSGDPDAAKQASTTIATAGRQALDELREMIGVLRRPQREDEQRTPAAQPPSQAVETGAAPQAPEADRGPAAGNGSEVGEAVLARLPELVNSSRSAGLPVELRTAGEPHRLPESTERAAYRIIQEALTNVHKHAPGAETEVTVAYRGETVRVGVRNSAPSAERAGEGTASDGEPLLPSGGHGLIGLRERVRLAGGTIETGQRRGGGFAVEAELPAAVTAGAGADGASGA